MKLRRAELAQFKEFGKAGGKARAAKMTPKQRSDGARLAAKARWAKLRQAVSRG